MTWSLVALADVPAQPWKNGGGVTRELLAWPPAGEWEVRMSVAQVERDGPFSAFAGVARWFAVLSGAGVMLRIGPQEHALTMSSEPLQFDGAATTDCVLLDGATQDFNLMVRGGRTARMSRIAGRAQERWSARSLVAAYAASPVALSVRDERFDVPEGTLAWRILETDAPVTLDGENAFWMEVAA